MHSTHQAIDSLRTTSCIHAIPHASLFVLRLPADRCDSQSNLVLLNAICFIAHQTAAENITNKTGKTKVSDYADTCLVILSFSAIFLLLVLTPPQTVQQLALQVACNRWLCSRWLCSWFCSM